MWINVKNDLSHQWGHVSDSDHCSERNYTATSQDRRLFQIWRWAYVINVKCQKWISLICNWRNTRTAPISDWPIRQRNTSKYRIHDEDIVVLQVIDCLVHGNERSYYLSRFSHEIRLGSGRPGNPPVSTQKAHPSISIRKILWNRWDLISDFTATCASRHEANSEGGCHWSTVRAWASPPTYYKGRLHRSVIHSSFRDPGPDHHSDSRPPNIDGYTCTKHRTEVRLKGVPRSARGTDKVNGKNRQSKGMNADRA
jgi:hypothetical protein